MAKVVKTNELPVMTDLTGAKAIGIDKNGDDAQFPLSVLRGDSLNEATLSTNPLADPNNPAGPMIGQYYNVGNIYGTFANFKGANNTAIVVPSPGTNKAYINARLSYNGIYWTYRSDIVDTVSVDLSGYATKTEVTSQVTTALTYDSSQNVNRIGQYPAIKATGSTAVAGDTFLHPIPAPYDCVIDFITLGLGTSGTFNYVVYEPNGSQMKLIKKISHSGLSSGLAVTPFDASSFNITLKKGQYLGIENGTARIKYITGSPVAGSSLYYSGTPAVDSSVTFTQSTNYFTGFGYSFKSVASAKQLKDASVAPAITSTYQSTPDFGSATDASIGNRIYFEKNAQPANTVFNTIRLDIVQAGILYIARAIISGSLIKYTALYSIDVSNTGDQTLTINIPVLKGEFLGVGAPNATPCLFRIKTVTGGGGLVHPPFQLSSSGIFIGGTYTGTASSTLPQFIATLIGEVNTAIDLINQLQSQVNTLQTSVAQNGAGSTRSIAGARGLKLFQMPNGDIVAIFSYGQSLNEGYQTQPPLSRDNVGGNYMLGNQLWVNNGNTNQGTLSPLVAKPIADSNKTYEETLAATATDDIRCEPPVIGFANAAKMSLDNRLMGSPDRKFLAVAAGQGGQRLSALSKNSSTPTYYQRFLNAINFSKTGASALSKTLVCGAIQFMQGETDYSNSTAKADYKTLLLQLITDMIADVRVSITQSADPIFLMYQTGGVWVTNFENTIGMAQLEVSNTDGRALMVSPDYFLPARVSGHLDANGSRWIGEYFQKAYDKVILRGEYFAPLQPKKITKSGNVIDIDFHVPVGELQFNTWVTPSVTNYGFAVKDAGNAAAISSVAIVSGSKVRITLASATTGDVEIGYANSAVSGKGNLCDSDPYIALTAYDATTPALQPPVIPTDKNGVSLIGKKYPLENWCVAFYYKVLAAQATLNIL